jgi:hypothetical protein
MPKKIAAGVFSIVVIASAIVVVLRLFSLSPEGATPVNSSTISSSTETTASVPEINTPVQNLNGDWMADDGSGVIIRGVVKDGQITLTLNKENAKMLYWFGTFQPIAGPGNIVKSVGIEIPKAVLSTATSKDFVVGENTISFELSAAGNTTIVELRRA